MASCDPVENKIRLGRWVCALHISPGCPVSITTRATSDLSRTNVTVEGYLQPISADPANDALYQFTGPEDPRYLELLEAAKLMRRELTALVENQRKYPQPILFSIKADTFEGMVCYPVGVTMNVDSFSLHQESVSGKFLSNGLKFTLELERIGSESQVEFETRGVASLRNNWATGILAPTFRSGIWAPPAEADLTTDPNNDGFQRDADTCDGIKTMRVFREFVRTATLDPGRTEARRWSIDFEDLPEQMQWGAATIWHSGINVKAGDTGPQGTIAIGDWVPNFGPTIPEDSWELENGIIRLRQWTDGTYAGVQLSSFWQGAWGPWRPLWLFHEGASGRPLVAWKHLTIMQNDPDSCRLRLTGATALDHLVDRRITLDVLLRRGCRHIEFLAHYPGADTNGFQLAGGAVSQTVVDQVTVRSSGTIANWRFPVVTPQGLLSTGGQNWDLPIGRYRRNERSVRWSIGATPPGFTTGGLEGWNNLTDDYMSATTTHVKTIIR